MAYASHTNLDHHYDPTVPRILGQFKEVEFSKTFEFCLRPEGAREICPEYPHLIYVSDRSIGGMYQYRFGLVLKTVAYVVVDEDDNGPIVEKWKIKGHRLYHQK
jgi:hypothetical protein